METRREGILTQKGQCQDRASGHLVMGNQEGRQDQIGKELHQAPSSVSEWGEVLAADEIKRVCLQAGAD